MIDFSTVIDVSEYEPKDGDEALAVLSLRTDARSFLESFEWCRTVVQCYVGICIAPVLGVMLFKIVPSRPDVDEWIWVVVGDVPSAYITTDQAPTPLAALDGYVGAMEQWVAAVQAGQPVDNLIPVNAPATPEFAALLERRIRFIDREILHVNDK